MEVLYIGPRNRIRNFDNDSSVHYIEIPSKTNARMEGKLNPESTFVHSPLSNYHHSQHGSMNLSESSESEAEHSDVSDMVVDNTSRFAGLNKERRKSGGSDYHPLSGSNSASASESASPSNSSNESYSERSTSRSTPLSQQKLSMPSAQLSDEDSETTEGTSSRSRSVSTQPFFGHDRLKGSPIVRKSPLNVSHRSNATTSNNTTTAMRGYRYSMLPSRSAAMNVSYSRYLDGESDSEEAVLPSRGRGRQRKRLKESESEFEMSVAESEGLPSEDLSLSEESSEEGYRPPKRKGRRKDKVCTYL